MGNVTHTPAEKERIRQKAAERKAAQENKAFYTLVIVTVILVAGVFLFNFVRDEMTLPAAIRNKNRIQDNWLVIDVDKTVGKRYHHPASFDAPQGYVPGSSVFGSTGESHHFTKYNDGVCRDFYLVAEDETAPVYALYVDAAANLTAAEYVQNYVIYYGNTQNEGTTIVPGEPFTATIAGMDAHCLYLHYTETRGEYGVLLCAFDAPRGVCVNAQLSGSFTTPENVQTQEQLLAEAEVLLAGLTIID